ncbi:MAG: hypothetical protein V1814_01990 [Candidatus Moraniibacteriota bacterium]
MKRVLYIVTALVLITLPAFGCGTNYDLDKPQTVEDIEITTQPLIGGTTIIIRLTNESGGKETLVSLGATDDERRIARCIKKGDEVAIHFKSRAYLHKNAIIKRVKNYTSGITCE